MVTFQLIKSSEERPERDIEFTVSKSASRVVLVEERKGQEMRAARPREVTQGEGKEDIRHSNTASSAFAEWDKGPFHAFGLVGTGAKPSLGVEFRGIREAVFVSMEDP
jgi:hypothetical protein